MLQKLFAGSKRLKAVIEGMYDTTIFNYPKYKQKGYFCVRDTYRKKVNPTPKKGKTNIPFLVSVLLRLMVRGEVTFDTEEKTVGESMNGNGFFK